MTPGKKAARTKLKELGVDGVANIARKAAATRRKLRDVVVADLKIHLDKTAKGAKARAKRDDRDFDEELEALALRLLEAHNYRCSVSGVCFDRKKRGGGKAPRPYAPSIDRIDSDGGYTEDNIRLICWACNCFFGTWGSEPAEKIARGMVARLKKR